jgi:hypothetical protein
MVFQIVIIILSAQLFIVNASDFALFIDGDPVSQGDATTVTGIGGSTEGIYTLWITNSNDESIWAVQDFFSDTGSFDYVLLIPLDWKIGSYVIHARDYYGDIVLSEVWNIIDYIQPEARFVLSDFIVRPLEAESGEEISISIIVTSVGDAAGEYEVELTLDNDIVASEYVILGVGESSTVHFNVSSEIIGSHVIEIGEYFESFNIITVQSSSFKIPWIVVDASIIIITIIGVYILRERGII